MKTKKETRKTYTPDPYGVYEAFQMLFQVECELLRAIRQNINELKK
jgi:hypothetical protein